MKLFVCGGWGVEGHLTHLLKPMSILLSLAALIGCTNQVEGSSAVSGANTLGVTNIL